ncbi:unnamed protein product [Durusdinium trenchii]|uniref:Uncharacterized protein n=1 Tax=Durusdinium trenchii TaxID=1381693 RepID=A0ABP0T1T8_9DINO
MSCSTDGASHLHFCLTGKPRDCLALHSEGASNAPAKVSWAALVDAHGPEAVDPDLCECTAEELAAYRLFCDGGIMDGFLAEERVKTPGVKSPFAVGQLVNHSESSNVEILQLDESLEETFAVGRLHQGLWYLDNQWRPVHVPSGRPVPIIALQASDWKDEHG